MKAKTERRLQALEQHTATPDNVPDVIELVPLTADGTLPEGCKRVVVWRKPRNIGEKCE